MLRVCVLGVGVFGGRGGGVRGLGLLSTLTYQNLLVSGVPSNSNIRVYNKNLQKTRFWWVKVCSSHRVLQGFVSGFMFVVVYVLPLALVSL